MGTQQPQPEGKTSGKLFNLLTEGDKLKRDTSEF
jgi:hypothetical protein